MARKKKYYGKKNPEGYRNPQDAAEVDEYRKGFAAGKNSKGSGKFAIETGAKDNDYTWYVPNSQMVKDVASFPFGINVGEPILTSHNLTAIDSEAITYMSNPGIAVFNVLPTIGSANDETSPVNIAGNNLFQAMQVESSRNPSYEMNDMMMAELALTEVYSYYAYLVRIYGVSNNYEFLNRYTPKALVNAMGVDFEDVKDHMAEFRAGINLLCNAMSSLYLPKTLDYASRKIFIYEGIYTDSNTAKAQYYMYKPIGFYQWSEGEFDHDEALPTALVFKPLFTTSTTLSVSQLLSYGWNLINPLRGSDDIRMMNADMLKAFGADNCYKASPISEEFKVVPGYNSEVLSQFENAYIAPHVNPNDMQCIIFGATDINTGYLMSQYSYSPLQANYRTGAYAAFENGWHHDYVVNFHHQDVKSEELLVATRCTQAPGYTWVTAGSTIAAAGRIHNYANGGFTLSAKTTEVICGVDLFYMNEVGSLKSSSVCTDMIINSRISSSGPSQNVAITAMSGVTLTTRFDWFPIIWPMNLGVSSATATSGTWLPIEPVFDLDNFTIIGSTQMSNLNRVAMIGLFTPKLKNVLAMK